MANRDTVKNWFKRGLKPLESQFHQLFDWIYFKDEGIAIGDVINLQTTLNGKADSATVNAIQSVVFPESLNRNSNFTYAMIGGRELERVRFKPTANISMRVGLTNGGEEIAIEIGYVANQWHTLVVNEFSDANRTLYFNGVTADTQFLFYKR